MNKYECRAECRSDVDNFINVYKKDLNIIKLESIGFFPDVSFKFETDGTYDEIINTLKNIDDTHVMIRTLYIK